MHFPGVRQPLDSDHLRERFYAFANRQCSNNPAGTKTWAEQNTEALLTDRVRKVLSSLKRLRPWQTTVRDALDQLIGDVERSRTRIQYQEPWQHGPAVRSGTVGMLCYSSGALVCALCHSDTFVNGNEL